MDIRLQTYAVYSLAVTGYGDLTTVDTLYAEIHPGFDNFSMAALALTYHELDRDDKGSEILAMLAESATMEEGQTYLIQAETDGKYHRDCV